MEHQKIINLLDSTQNEPSKSRTRNWVEMNDQSRGTYNASNQIKIKISLIRSNLCYYSDTYINVNRTITIQTVEQQRPQIMPMKKQYLKIVLHLLNA